MRKKFFYFITCIGLPLAAASASAATSVATIPVGLMEFAIPHGVTSYLSIPLTKDAVYTGSVAGVTANTITVDDKPAPFTGKLGTADAPYFVKFLSGNEAGRVLLVESNTSDFLTLDTTDHTTGSAVALTTTGFSVETGDTFEIFPGDTLASIFGTGAPGNPLVLAGAATQTVADEVALYTTVGAPAKVYYFNTTAGFWETTGTTINALGEVVSGSGVNANDTIIYPYSAFTVVRRSNHPDTSLVLLGRVTPVNASTKTVGHAGVYTSTHYASDLMLSQLKFGANWQTGNTAATADTLSVWSSATHSFEVYFEKPDSTWRKSGDNVTDQSHVIIPAGTVTEIHKLAIVTGAQAFLVSAMPYTLD
jgi:uncharacterized protein (TIGR02597 family)